MSVTPNQPAAHTPNPTGDWNPLKTHLQDVANGAQNHANKFAAGQLGYYAGLWHDLGKYNPAFQKYLQQCAQGLKPSTKAPHAWYGAKLARERCPLLTSIILGHHSGLGDRAELSCIFAPTNQKKRDENKAYPDILKRAQADGINLNLSESLTLPEWANNELSYELFTRLLFSSLIDADYADTEEHLNPEKFAQRANPIKLPVLGPIFNDHMQRLAAKAQPSLVNTVRREVYQACLEATVLAPGVFRLEVPTGGGKTLSGLGFALNHALKHGLDRVIVAVPYTSIIEQTVKVYRDVFKSLGPDAVLEHHSAIVEESAYQRQEEAQEESAQPKYLWSKLATENWDAPLIVTTTVQLFESLFSNRPRKCRKLHNITKSVIILDEVQTLPLSLLEPIINILDELAKNYSNPKRD